MGIFDFLKKKKQEETAQHQAASKRNTAFSPNEDADIIMSRNLNDPNTLLFYRKQWTGKGDSGIDWIVFRSDNGNCLITFKNAYQHYGDTLPTLDNIKAESRSIPMELIAAWEYPKLLEFLCAEFCVNLSHDACVTDKEYYNWINTMRKPANESVCLNAPHQAHDTSIKLHSSDFKFLFMLKNENQGSNDLPFHFYGLNRQNGTALKRISKPDENGFAFFQAIEYSDLISLSRNSKSCNLSGLTAQNWYAYCLLRDGDLLIFASKTAGTGPYHEETHYGLHIDTDGYFLRCSTGSPMSGMFDNSQHLPIGFFADKTIAEIKNFIYDNSGYVSQSSISFNDRDLEILIETDKYRLSKKQPPTA